MARISWISVMRVEFVIEGALYGSPLGFADRWIRVLDHLTDEGWAVIGRAATEAEGPITGLPIAYARPFSLRMWKDGVVEEREAFEAVDRAIANSGPWYAQLANWFSEIRKEVVTPSVVEIGNVARRTGRAFENVMDPAVLLPLALAVLAVVKK